MQETSKKRKKENPEDYLFSDIESIFEGIKIDQSKFKKISFRGLLQIDHSILKDDFNMEISDRLLLISRIEKYKAYSHLNFQQKCQYDIYFESKKSQNKELSDFFEKIFTLSSPSISLTVKEKIDLDVLSEFGKLNSFIEHSIGKFDFFILDELVEEISMKTQIFIISDEPGEFPSLQQFNNFFEKPLLFLNNIKCDHFRFQIFDKRIQKITLSALENNNSLKSITFSRMDKENLDSLYSLLKKQKKSNIYIFDYTFNKKLTDEEIVKIIEYCGSCESLIFDSIIFEKLENWKKGLELFFSEKCESLSVIHYPYSKEKIYINTLLEIIKQNMNAKTNFIFKINNSFSNLNFTERDSLRNFKNEQINQIKLDFEKGLTIIKN